MASTESPDARSQRPSNPAGTTLTRPQSTYRIQFHSKFTFNDAKAIVPYLASLGVTHLYASPYMKAQPGSTHGYDVIDHCSLNPELGTQADYEAFSQAILEHGMSQILDTVPNHAGVANNENHWWNDALENGPDSRYGHAFDISWTGSPRPDLQNRVLLPLLGKPYDACLRDGDLRIKRDETSGKLSVHYFQRYFPLNAVSTAAISDEESIERINQDPDALDATLSRQHYRLAYWKVAPDEINYRRFFDVNDLAALAMEREEVFAETHELTMKLVAEGKVSGLRIDHPDGLSDPVQYFERLQEAYRRVRLEAAKPATPPLYVLGEKILAMDERLDVSLLIDGTTGYRFLNVINGLFVDPAGDESFTDLYRELTGAKTDFAALVFEKKRLILTTTMASEMTMLTERLLKIAMQMRSARDISRRVLHESLADVIASFPVYRTYIIANHVSETDAKRIESAVTAARHRSPLTDDTVFDFIRDTLLQNDVETLDEPQRHERQMFATRFQQLTSPVMAKGVEDTAFYVYNRLVSLNEVGGDPSVFGIEPSAAHDYLKNRQAHWPYALSSLSTHDTKRSEDVRARLNILSEIPARWRQAVKSWMQMNRADHSAGPTANEEYLLYQALLGIWPLDDELKPLPEDWIQRVNAYLLKAMREAKETTLWTQPNEPHEKAVSDFVERICSVKTSKDFLSSFHDFARPIARLGLFNSLAQTVLKLTAPGVPDTYQGQELWDFSLVDPDNRRPVDYALRRHAVESLHALVNAHRNDLTGVARDLVGRMTDGHSKLWVTQNCLTARRDHPDLFTRGSYTPLQASGAKAENVFVFARQFESRSAIVVVPRLISSIVNGEQAPIGPAVWGDTTLQLPSGIDRHQFRNLFTGETLGTTVGELLGHFPVGVFISS